MQLFVEPEPTARKLSSRKSRMAADIKNQLKASRILASSKEGIESRRIVPNFTIDDGLVADFFLKSAKYDVVEIVESIRENEGHRKLISDIALSNLVFEHTKLKFGRKNTNTKMIYFAAPNLENFARPSLDTVEKQGAALFNWSSHEDQKKFLKIMSEAAVPSFAEKSKDIIFNNNSFSFH